MQVPRSPYLLLYVSHLSGPFSWTVRVGSPWCGLWFRLWGFLWLGLCLLFLSPEGLAAKQPVDDFLCIFQSEAKLGRKARAHSGAARLADPKLQSWGLKVGGEGAPQGPPGPKARGTTFSNQQVPHMLGKCPSAKILTDSLGPGSYVTTSGKSSLISHIQTIFPIFPTPRPNLSLLPLRVQHRISGSHSCCRLCVSLARF